jgi:hypothetical protein
MTTEYMLEPGQSHEELARDLLEQAASPDQVHWSPRPDVYGGGVYVLADEGIAQRTREVRQARRADEAKRIEEAQAAADERDANPDVAEGLLTPSEAGFSASTGTDPGSAGAAQANADAVEAGQRPDAPADAAISTDTEADRQAGTAEADDDADAADDAEGEPKLTPAQKRAAAKKAKQAEAAKADDAADADEEKSE